MIESIKPARLRDELADDRRAPPVLLDVREPEEFALCRIDGSVHIPMSRIRHQLDSLDRDENIVVICHHGIRSLQVAGLLVHNGFERVRNLAGGIDAWADEVDPSLPRY